MRTVSVTPNQSTQLIADWTEVGAFYLDGRTMDMLLLRPRAKRGEKVGRYPVHRVRGRKFGPVLHEQTLQTRRDLAVYGPHSCGKSRWLAKLHGQAGEVWPGRPAFVIRGLEPLQQWLDQPEAGAWHDQQPGAKPWDKLPQHGKLAALIAWAGACKAVLLLDDAHRLAGRKAEIAVALVRAAGLVVHAASEETRIALSLRLALSARDPQVVRLSSDAAYDYTSVFTWALCILAAAMGAWPVAAAIGGLKLVGRGGRAAKQS